MNELTNWSEVFLRSFQAFGQQLLGAVPSILGAVVILLLGWLFSKVVSRGVARLLRLARFNDLADKFNASEFLKRANVQTTPSEVIGTFVYWILMLMVIISSSDAMGWTAVTLEVSKLLGLLPNLLVAVIFFVVGYYIASFVRDIIRGAAGSLNIGTGKMIGGFVFYLLMVLISLSALNQAGVDTSIITNNLMLILGAILAAASISYGFASKDVLANILAGYFSRRTFDIGQTIEVDNVKGAIVSVSNISVIVQTSEHERVVIPTQELITKKVKIIG